MWYIILEKFYLSVALRRKINKLIAKEQKSRNDILYHSINNEHFALSVTVSETLYYFDIIHQM